MLLTLWRKVLRVEEKNKEAEKVKTQIRREAKSTTKKLRKLNGLLAKDDVTMNIIRATGGDHND